MNKRKKDSFNVDDLLGNLFRPEPTKQKETLQQLVERRVDELEIAITNICSYLEIEPKTLNNIITGKQKRTDYTNILKIATFLQLPREQVIELYIEALEKNFSLQNEPQNETMKFIKDNFDLVTLRSAGFIKNTRDYAEIEKVIVSYFGLKSITDYQLPKMDVAFSEGFYKPKNFLTRGFWLNAAKTSFESINNPYKFDKEGLVKYFPQIRWHSTSVELGLTNIIKDLFKLGVTVLFQSPFSNLHLRGATFAVNEKPVVVITDYRGFYPTIWFALVHELFHVLFDWQEIQNNKYHLTGSDDDQLAISEKEKEANDFASRYFLSTEKVEYAKRYLYDAEFIARFAKENDVHESFVYVFAAWNKGKNNNYWSIAKEYNPPLHLLINPISNSWDNHKSISEFTKSLKYKLYT